MLKRRIAFLVFGFVFVSTAANAQNDANNWIFGYHAGLNFGNFPFSGTPAINSVTACSSISDAAGNLLFYTDSRGVWNKQHQLMNAVSSPSSFLHGDMNASQGALIVPRPGSGCNEYYI